MSLYFLMISCSTLAFVEILAISVYRRVLLHRVLEFSSRSSLHCTSSRCSAAPSHLLDVAVRQHLPVFELLFCEDRSLLFGCSGCLGCSGCSAFIPIVSSLRHEFPASVLILKLQGLLSMFCCSSEAAVSDSLCPPRLLEVTRRGSCPGPCPGPLVLVLVLDLVPDPRYVPPRISAATLPERGSLRCALSQPVFRMRFLPAVGYALDVLLHVLFPAVGYALSFLLHVFALLLGMLFYYPLWVRSFLPAVGPLFSTRCGSALFYDIIQSGHHVLSTFSQVLRLRTLSTCCAWTVFQSSSALVRHFSSCVLVKQRVRFSAPPERKLLLLCLICPSSATLWYFTAPWSPPLAPPTPLRSSALLRGRWFAVDALVLHGQVVYNNVLLTGHSVCLALLRVVWCDSAPLAPLPALCRWSSHVAAIARVCSF